jgi:hypothetical protein
MRYFSGHILFVALHPISFGDGITNMRMINILKNSLNGDYVVHALLHPTTIACLSSWIEREGLIDRIYAWTGTYRLRQRYDYVIRSEGVTDEFNQNFVGGTVIIGKDQLFSAGGDAIAAAYQYGNVSKWSNFVTGDYCLYFPNSSRHLSRIPPKTSRKIIEILNKNHLRVILCGETIHPYTLDDKVTRGTENWTNDIRALELHDGVLSVAGASLGKVMELSKRSKFALFAPTGAAMLGICNALHCRSLMIHAGDSPIMRDIWWNTTRTSKMEFMTTSCPHFPCGNRDGAKPEKCRTDKEALCLGEEFDLLHFEELVQKELAKTALNPQGNF